MKYLKENFYILFFLFVIYLLLILSFFSKDKKFSDYENRVLQTMPKFSIESFFDGNFQDDFDVYTSDQLVFKNNFVRLKNYMELAQLKIAINDVYLANDNFYIERHSKNQFDEILVYKNIECLNKFVDKFNAEAYLVPNACDVLDDKLFFKDDFDFKEVFKDNKYFIVEDIFKEYKGSEDLYFKTDHHWNIFGAYELYKNIVDKPVDLNLEKVDDNFLGTINNKLNIIMKPDILYKQKTNTNFEVYYDLGKENQGFYFPKYLSTKDKYSYYLDGNHSLVNIINNSINNDEKVLIIKDSYANCFIPFISENYKIVDVIDLRFFNMSLNQYIEANKYDRIIILYNKSGFLKEKNVFKLNK